jgi:hypothetical protein
MTNSAAQRFRTQKELADELSSDLGNKKGQELIGFEERQRVTEIPFPAAADPTIPHPGRLVAEVGLGGNRYPRSNGP